MANWSFLLASSLGGNLAELSTASGKALTFTRNGVPEATCSISHEDAAAALLLADLRNGLPTLRAYRDGILRFHGYLAPFSETLEESTQLDLTFRGPFGRLIGDGQSPGRFTAVNRRFTATDAGQIAVGLINDANTTGITGVRTDGAIAVTKTRDRAYQYANIGEAIVNLTRVLDGFDFEVTPIEYANGYLGRFNVYATQGAVLNGVDFEYGPETLANVRSVTRQTQPPRNVARVLGANGLVAETTNAASVLTYGQWWVQEQLPDVSEQATLNDKAQALLRPALVKVVRFAPEPALAPRPWDDYWLGDTVAFYGRRDAFEEASSMRVNVIRVVIDDDGNEAFEIDDPTGDGAVQAVVEGEVTDSDG